jgi:hypothetical protein
MAHPKSPERMFTLSVQYGATVALVTCSGRATTTELYGTLCFGGEMARHSHRRILFDLVALDFAGPAVDPREVAMVAERLSKEVLRVAMVLPPELCDLNIDRLTMAAGKVRCFDQLSDAFGWLVLEG